MISDVDRVGNDWADLGAKRGAQLHILGRQPVKRYMDELARAVAWLRFSVWVHGVCNQDRSWSNDVWERDLVPNPKSGTLKLTAPDFRPTPGKPGYQHCVHCRLLVVDAASLMRGMNKPCLPVVVFRVVWPGCILLIP